MTEPLELVAIGVIEKPFGVRGEMRVRSLSDVPGRFEGLAQVTLESPAGALKQATVRSVRGMRGSYLLSLDLARRPKKSRCSGAGSSRFPRVRRRRCRRGSITSTN